MTSQYRLLQVDRSRSEIRDSLGERKAALHFDRANHAVVRTAHDRFSLGRSGPTAATLTDDIGTTIARAQFSGAYELVNHDLRLQWKPLSLWHGVFGWTLPDQSVVIRYVPTTQGDQRDYLITVEKRVEAEVRWIAIGAFLLRLAGTDSVAWISATNAAATNVM